MAIIQTVLQLGTSFLRVASQRLELASLDFEEELLRLGILLASTLITSLILALALAAAATTVVVYFWDSARLTALIGVTSVFSVVGLAMAWRLAHALRNKPKFMASTLAELAKDRASSDRTS
jgi:uncharacterized membrane protein YqjE